MNEQIRVEHLPWDSDFFGVPVGRIVLSTANVEPEQLKSVLQQSGEGLIYVFLPVGSMEDCCAERPRSALVEIGGKCVDLKVTYRKQIAREVCNAENGITASQITPALEALAYASGWSSRFVRDERLECFFKPMYLIWLKRDLERGRVFVWPSADKPEGMATVSIAADGLGKVGLVAVDAESCGKGIGTRLLKNICCYLAQNGVLQCEVVTQGVNLAARHLYEKVGFKLFSQYEVWHVWKDRVL